MNNKINKNFASVHHRGKNMEDSTPQPNWTKINCIVKRNNIKSYEVADKQFTEKLHCSTTEQEATELLPVLSPTLSEF